MKIKILELIKSKPKHYSLIISKDKGMLAWVNANTLSETDHLPSKIWSAIHQVSLSCPSGKVRNISRWSTGLVGCGPASSCQCTRNSISVQTSLSKSGCSQVEKENSNSKRAASMIKKYGVEFNSQRTDMKHIWTKPKIPKEAFDKLSDPAWLGLEYVQRQRSAVDIAQQLGVYYSTVTSYCIDHGFKIRRRSSYSLTETEIEQFILSLGIRCENSNWSILKNKEIDLYIPEHKIGIEVNGLYWHSFNPANFAYEDSRRHLNKSIEAEAAGISLIHITDWEWKNKQEIVKSMLCSKLGKCKRIYARNTVVKEVSTQDARKFLDDNHIQGFISSKYYLGLYLADSLVMVISAGRNRFSDQKYTELHRMSCLKNTTVVGGGSKLLNALTDVCGTPIISYCDRSKSNGRGYISMGFSLARTSSPGYFWTNGTEILSRFKCQKAKLRNWLQTFDQNKTESENMFLSKYRRFWDCGNYVFTRGTHSKIPNPD
jgi:hypothetical protein